MKMVLAISVSLYLELTLLPLWAQDSVKRAPTPPQAPSVTKPPPLPPSALAKFNRRLIQASVDGDIPAIIAALAAGANPNSRDLDGSTPLKLAATAGHVAVVKVLLAKHADPNATNAFGHTALMSATWGRHSGIIELLTLAGAKLPPEMTTETTQPKSSPQLVTTLASEAETLKSYEQCVRSTVDRLLASKAHGVTEYAVAQTRGGGIWGVVKSGGTHLYIDQPTETDALESLARALQLSIPLGIVETIELGAELKLCVPADSVRPTQSLSYAELGWNRPSSGAEVWDRAKKSAVAFFISGRVTGESLLVPENISILKLGERLPNGDNCTFGAHILKDGFMNIKKLSHVAGEGVCSVQSYTVLPVGSQFEVDDMEWHGKRIWSGLATVNEEGLEFRPWKKDPRKKDGERTLTAERENPTANKGQSSQTACVSETSTPNVGVGPYFGSVPDLSDQL